MIQFIDKVDFIQKIMLLKSAIVLFKCNKINKKERKCGYHDCQMNIQLPPYEKYAYHHVCIPFKVGTCNFLTKSSKI